MTPPTSDSNPSLGTGHRAPVPSSSALGTPSAALSRAVQATSLMTIASRIGGLVRDVVLGRMFGAGIVGSAFQAAFAVPNMFRRLFGEGALSAAFIPEYTDALRTSKQDADRLASLTLVALGLVTTALTILIELILLAILLLAPHDPERALLLQLSMVMLPFMPLICTVAIQAGMLQVHGRYGPAASGPIILNTFIVVTGLYYILGKQPAAEPQAYILAIATVLSGVTQCCWFFFLLRPHVQWTRAWKSIRPRASAMLKRFFPVAIGLGTLQLNTLIDTLIATWPIAVGPTILGRQYPLDGSSNVILSLTSRLYQFPLGVFGIAIASAAFPLLAKHAKEPDHFLDTLRRGLRLSLYISLPAGIGLFLVRHDALGVLYGHGAGGWNNDSLARAAAVLTGFAAGIWAYSLNQVLTRAFYAQGDTITPMKLSLGMIVLNIGLNCTLIWIPGLREAGLAYSTAACAVIQCVFLAILCARLLRRMGAHHQLTDAHMNASTAKIVLATLLMGAAVWLALSLLPALAPRPGFGEPRNFYSGWSWQLTRLIAATAVGGLSYLALSKLLHIPELSWLMHRRVRESESTQPPV